MTKFLILHGTDATPNNNWFMWLKGALIGQGHKVWLPQLPNAVQPNTNAYNKFLFANSDFVLDKDTIIVGHSSGAVAALNLLQHLPAKTSVKAVVAVSAFKDNLGMQALSGLFIEPLDFKIIKKRAEKFVFIHSDNDPYVAFEQADYLATQLKAKLILFKDQGHFNTELDERYRQFPELLDIIDTLTSK